MVHSGTQSMDTCWGGGVDMDSSIKGLLVPSWHTIRLLAHVSNTTSPSCTIHCLVLHQMESFLSFSNRLVAQLVTVGIERSRA